MSRPVDPAWIRNPSDELAIGQGCWFDADEGEFVCDFIQTFCRQSNGDEWAGKPIVLLDWQRDMIMRLFGWRKADGRRRFRRLYCEVAKKNGKSTLVSALTLFLLLADDKGPQVFLNACDRGQARIVFDEAKKMAGASPELSGRLEIIDSRHRIAWPEGNGVIIANSADAPNKDGLNPSAVIFDELHRQPDAQLWDIFKYAGAARKQPLTISITTAGEDESGVWFEQREYSEKVNRGEVPDTTHLGVIHRADPADDIDDPATWKKANPSLGVTIAEEEFAAELAEARQTPRLLAGFKRLRLNIVTKADVVFIDPDDWKACDSPKVDRSGLVGLPCYVGGDLSRTIDLTAMVALWGDEDSGFDLAAWFWMPEGNVKELSRRDRVPYQLWIDEGWITATPGDVVDYGFIRREINDLAADHDLRGALFDPYNATKLLIELEQEDGLPVAEIRQGFLSLSAPTKQLERLVKGRKIRNGSNPVMKWMIGNAVADGDAAGNVKLSKKKSRLKIDGAAALVNAIAAATTQPARKESIYNSQGIMFL